jgi:hypothetical protein
MEYLGAWGTLIHEKNLKSKISCQTPFNHRWVIVASTIFNTDGSWVLYNNDLIKED